METFGVVILVWGFVAIAAWLADKFFRKFEEVTDNFCDAVEDKVSSTWGNIKDSINDYARENKFQEEARRRQRQEEENKRSQEEASRIFQEEFRRMYEEAERRQQQQEEEERKRRYYQNTSYTQSSFNDEVKKAFDILELPYSATWEDVKRKRIFLLQFYHPDHHNNQDPSVTSYATEKTKQINEACELLKKYFNIS